MNADRLGPEAERRLRDLAPRVLGAIVRRTVSELTTRFGRGSGWRQPGDERRAVASVRPSADSQRKRSWTR